MMMSKENDLLINQIEKNKDETPLEMPHRSENRDTDAGQGCATRISFRANVGISLSFNLIDILESSDGSF